MAKTVTTGFIADIVNGIKVNSSIKCNAGNFKNNASRSVAYVVMHYTGNPKDTAKANANYFSGAGRNASAHFFVDDSEIYQSVELRDTAWHCGAKSYYHNFCRNANSIGIEMCCTAGNYKISEKTKKNTAYLCAYICKMLGISAGEVDTYVLRHYDVTNKNCPAQMACDSSEWTAFKSMVKEILGDTIKKEENGTQNGTWANKSVAEVAQEVKAGKWGNNPERKQRLEAAGYNYTEVQAAVNAFINGSGSAQTTYTVKRGDTLSAIANQYNTTIAALVKLNNIKDADIINVGQVLKLR